MNIKEINTHLENAVFNFIVTTKDIANINSFIEAYKEVTDKINYSYLERDGVQYTPKKDINQPYVSRMFDKFNIVKDKKTKLYVVDVESSLLVVQKTLKDELSKFPIRCHDIIGIPESSDLQDCGIFYLTIDVPIGTESYIASILYRTLSSNSGENISKRTTAFNSIIVGFRSVTITCHYKENIQFIYNTLKKLNPKYEISEDDSYFVFNYNEKDVEDIMSPDIQVSMYAALGDKDTQRSLEICNSLNDSKNNNENVDISNSNYKSSNTEYRKLFTEGIDNFFDELLKDFSDEEIEQERKKIQNYENEQMRKNIKK